MDGSVTVLWWYSRAFLVLSLRFRWFRDRFRSDGKQTAHFAVTVPENMLQRLIDFFGAISEECM